jgi:hypothetical protein
MGKEGEIRVSLSVREMGKGNMSMGGMGIRNMGVGVDVRDEEGEYGGRGRRWGSETWRWVWGRWGTSGT